MKDEVSTASGSDRVAADFQDCYPVATALGTDSTTVVLQIKTPLGSVTERVSATLPVMPMTSY